MDPYAFLAKLAGLGLVAGTAVAMVKLVEKLWPKTGETDSTFEYIAVSGEFPPEVDAACADGGAAQADAANPAGEHAAGANAAAETANDAKTPMQKTAAPAAAPVPAAAQDTPNENPVDAPPAVPVTDPLKIADPADFQNWDDLGCQG